MPKAHVHKLLLVLQGLTRKPVYKCEGCDTYFVQVAKLRNRNPRKRNSTKRTRQPKQQPNKMQNM